MTPTVVEMEFLCRNCRLLTPTVTEIPPAFEDATRMAFRTKCLHCGKKCTRIMTAADARAGKGERQ